MASAVTVALTLLGVVALVAVNTALAAVATRFFRLRLSTRWGAAVYTVLLVPVAFVGTTLVAFGALGVGSGLDLSRDVLVLLAFVAPLALGISVDMFLMPAPEAVDVADAR